MTSVLHYLPELRLSRTLPFARLCYLPVSLLHLSVCRWYWNIYQLVIIYAFRAGRNLPDKEFRYLRTVIVTAAVHWGLSSTLRCDSNISP